MMSLEEGVRRLTALPAERIGLTDRGRLAEGLKADICVFNPATVAFECTIAEPRAHPPGFRHVMVNGVLALRDGARTEANPGAVLRSGA
jgi:N-acyl-D-amino-acid deacylase